MNHGSSHRSRRSGDHHHRPPVVLASALLCATALLAAACTGGGEDSSVDVVTEIDAEGLALDNGFASASTDFELTSSGTPIEVDYFEALRKGTWTAPEHCWFNTRVSVGSLESPGFDGPTSDDDTAAGEGALVGSQARVYMPAYDSAGPVPTTIAEGTGATPVQAPRPFIWYPLEELENPPEGMPEGFESSDVSGGVHVDVALVIAYGHDQVIEASSDATGVLDKFSSTAQPLDGWNVVEVAFDPAEAPEGDLPVKLRRLRTDGTESTEELLVPRSTPGLELVTPDWEFDLAAVDESCRVPSGDNENVPAEPDRDLLGAEIGDAPLLPEPGEQPAEVAEAADEALAAIRKVYDLGDIYAPGKGAFVEDPDAYAQMRDDLIADDVVAPYVSNLDPVFRSIVFTSPTEGVVLYRVGPSYQWEAGRVLLIDGTWRVAAGTLCRDLSAAGYTCRDAAPDPPPGPLG